MKPGQLLDFVLLHLNIIYWVFTMVLLLLAIGITARSIRKARVK